MNQNIYADLFCNFQTSVWLFQNWVRKWPANTPEPEEVRLARQQVLKLYNDILTKLQIEREVNNHGR